MRPLRISLLFSCVLLLGACAAVLGHSRPLGFWENGSTAVQVVHVNKGLGTGMVVDVRGLVLTNYHVVQRVKDEDTDELSGTGLYQVCVVSDLGKSCWKAFVVATDELRDMALLRVVDYKFNRAVKRAVKVDHKFERAVKFVSEDELQPGDELYMWGNYLDILPPVPFFGRYVGKVGPPYVLDEETAFALPVLAVDNSATSGGSGSPVFDGLGRCVGMFTGLSNIPDGAAGRTVALITPASFLEKFVNENNPFTKK